MTKLVYVSEVMKRLMDQVFITAKTNCSILITGEAGTGKELMASTIHEKSSRLNKPLVRLNCGALRETLLESELFGHEKGSFTGAYTRKIGLIEIANGGTLYLSSIDELGAGLQAKLLNFVKTGEYFRVGGNEPLKANVRLITSSIDLEKQVNNGSFREDLYYAINTITINIPPLRRRKEDIPVLVKHFISENNYLGNASVESITDAALEYLSKYSWPGNVRELENTITRSLVLAEGDRIDYTDLPDSIQYDDAGPEGEYDPELTLHDLEKQHILAALKHFNGNKTKAAHALGITIKTLYNKLHMYGEI